MLPDHYQALGIPPFASREEVRAAYLAVMRTHHPDRRPGDPRSAARSRAANAAWEVLGDSARRASYDLLRAEAARTGRSQVRAVAGPPAATPPAYSAERTRYGRAFDRATAKMAAAVFLFGFLLLLAAR